MVVPGPATTVQTVVTAGTEHREQLHALRDNLITLGVRHWVLHVVSAAWR
jgi:hypothetical protein